MKVLQRSSMNAVLSGNQLLDVLAFGTSSKLLKIRYLGTCLCCLFCFFQVVVIKLSSSYPPEPCRSRRILGGHHQDQEAIPDGLRCTARPCLRRDMTMGTAKLYDGYVYSADNMLEIVIALNCGNFANKSRQWHHFSSEFKNLNRSLPTLTVIPILYENRFVNSSLSLTPPCRG